MDPERRFKTIEGSKKNSLNSNPRASRLRGRGRYPNELEAELESFVDWKKLNITGSTEEAGRVRQHKNIQTVRAMFGELEPGEMNPAARFRCTKRGACGACDHVLRASRGTGINFRGKL